MVPFLLPDGARSLSRWTLAQTRGEEKARIGNLHWLGSIPSNMIKANRGRPASWARRRGECPLPGLLALSGCCVAHPEMVHVLSDLKAGDMNFRFFIYLCSVCGG